MAENRTYIENVTTAQALIALGRRLEQGDIGPDEMLNLLPLMIVALAGLQELVGVFANRVGMAGHRIDHLVSFPDPPGTRTEGGSR